MFLWSEKGMTRDKSTKAELISKNFALFFNSCRYFGVSRAFRASAVNLLDFIIVTMSISFSSFSLAASIAAC